MLKLNLNEDASNDVNYNTSNGTWVYTGEYIKPKYRDSITNIVFEKGIKTIGSYEFSDCKHLTSITIPNTVTEIGMEAFKGCTSLTNVTIPDSVVEIGMEAFKWCSSLSKLVIPNSVTKIRYDAFIGCSKLTIFTDNDYVKQYCHDYKINVLPLTENDIPNKNNDVNYIKIGKAIANYYEEISFDRNGIIIYTDNQKALYKEITDALKSIENIE